ncbi:hypothetical protein XA68_10234 [Ophiocordyceps unilateralis]|uniref:protein-histidine N-methyltransferase n=1 Tax=Ophiocordyceps unilateralis TaxID=268505 RepID=A0A2A9P2Q5_OPHUN|nr:hypothetical protein XA68_10234 [Ophiocordyceps unilateralis]
MAFSFAFSGDDIDAQPTTPPSAAVQPPAAGAFPVVGRPQLPPTRHDLAHLLSRLPSKLAYSCLDVVLDDGSNMRIPRRELWDVRLQLMAEDDGLDRNGEALGDHDIKTGLYEGGFKSWESSVDLVKVLAAQRALPSSWHGRTARIIELGCGTALPSLAVFIWAMGQEPLASQPMAFVLADYNPSVLQLVTLPNFVLAWALHRRKLHTALCEAFSLKNELELGPEVLQAFVAHLSQHRVTLFFVSGAWSHDLVQIVNHLPSVMPETCALSPVTLILGAETIYSPLALRAFVETLLALLDREKNKLGGHAEALVAAKKLYFGVGGSLCDFIADVESRGARVTLLREEAEGVRRGVVHCVVPHQGLADQI